jgi:hypothetical protein
MKKELRNLAHRMKTWPIIGRAVRIAIAVVRLPETRETLTQTLEAFQAVQRRDNDRENLVKSVPVALRMFKQELGMFKQELDEMKIRQIQIQDTYKANDISSLRDSMNYLMGRVEFVRRELIFEMRYGATSPTSDKDHIKAKTQIISTDKLEKAQNNTIKLNLGCGHIAIDNYLNVDRRALPGVDIVAEVDELPFEQNEIDEIFSAHLLEHFPQEQLKRELLPYWASLIKPGGVFRAVIPDANSMILAYADGTFPYSSLREVTFGAQDYDGDFHFNMFVPEQLSELLEEAGLINFELVAQGRKNGECFEMEITAIKK